MIGIIMSIFFTHHLAIIALMDGSKVFGARKAVAVSDNLSRVGSGPPRYQYFIFALMFMFRPLTFYIRRARFVARRLDIFVRFFHCCLGALVVYV